MHLDRRAALTGALMSLLALSATPLLRADEAALLRVTASSTPGEYSVSVETAEGCDACSIAAVSFALAVPAGTSGVEPGAGVWTDAPVPAVQSVSGGLIVGAIIEKGHDLSEGPFEILRFQASSAAGIAFAASLAGTAVATVVSTVDGRSIPAYTRVLGGETVAPDSGSSGSSESGGESGGGGMSMMGSEEQPCDLVEIVKEVPETADYWLEVPGDYDEIQEALDDVYDVFSAISGVVVIEVATGTYEPIEVDLTLLVGKGVSSLTIFSTSGPDLTIIEGTSTARPVLIHGDVSSSPVEFYLGLVTADDGNVIDSSDWLGFTIRSFPSGGPVNVGGGVAILDCTPDGEETQVVELRGNKIVECAVGSVGPNGGGMAILRSRRVHIIRNEIANNLLYGSTSGSDDGDGAGLYVGQSEVVVVSNWIHDNGFVATTADLAAQGGGVALGTGTLELCGNLIELNRAKVGGGVWARMAFGFVGTGHADAPPRLYARENRILENSVWDPSSGGTNNVSYRGGGIYVTAGSVGATAYELLVLSNQLSENNIVTVTSQPSGSPSEAGGGLYVDLELPAWGSSIEFYPAFESNLFLGNIANLDGGGGWVYAEATQFTTSGEHLRFHNNTALLNELEGGSGLRGSGVFFAGAASLGSGAENVFDASSNISFENQDDSGTTLQTFAECPDTGSAPWRYSQMEGSGGGGCPGASGWDLTAGSNNASTDPDFRSQFSLNPTGRIAEDSPCVDTAEAALEGDLLALTDFDGQPRIYDSPHVGASGVDLDRGGDEVNLFPFYRGDANGDAFFNIADAVSVGNFLFFGQPMANCEDAYDANDDEAVQISDQIYILAALFSGGPPPPAPHDGFASANSCGLDPTAGELVCDFEVSTCP